MRVYAARGAITIESDTKDEITLKSVRLFKQLLEENDIKKGEEVSLIISATSDIHAFYPARAVRESGILDIPLFSTLEPDIDGALKLCIRMLITFQKDTEFKPKHAYLEKAAALRPDLK